jgi:hypothetical protein
MLIEVRAWGRAQSAKKRGVSMSLASSAYISAANPLDIVEEIVSANEWSFDRTSEDEMIVDFPGQWCGLARPFRRHALLLRPRYEGAKEPVGGGL